LSEKWLLFVGYYADKSSPGLSVYSFDSQQGTAELKTRYAGVANPSFHAYDPARRRLYAVSETMEFEGRAGGAVGVWSVDPANGTLQLLQLEPTHGGAPCHVVMSPERDGLLVTNYAGGNVALFPLDREGNLAPAVMLSHSGSGPNPARQEAPHPHSAVWEPMGGGVLVADLGIDRLVRYEWAPGGGGLRRTGEIPANPGAGPRHAVFHPRGDRLYVVNELDSTVSVYAYAQKEGRMLQTISTLPERFSGENTCADIHTDPQGAFLYASNRGHDSIAIFRILEDGTLAAADYAPTGGRTPRNFALTPDGRYLLAANQDSNTITLFRRDECSGKLEQYGVIHEPSKPVCLKFAPM
jgi:6-phosphogluconolactonase